MSEAGVLRFGPFELHQASQELRQNGDLVRLPPQPFKVLLLLAGRGGEVVTRNEIRDHVWSGDTFVDFEQGLNFCIRQIREALGDHAVAPRFVETIPRRGYRFLAPVTAGIKGVPDPPRPVTRLIVLPFRLLRSDPDTDFLAFSLPDALTVSLGCLKSLVVRSSMTAARFTGERIDPKTVAAEVDVDMIVTGTLMRAGDAVRVTAQLTDASTGSLVWSDMAQADFGDVFRLQDDLTHRIVASLSLPLTKRDAQLLHHDVPATAKAYEYFLRGNQLSYDSKQYAVARDWYQRAVDEDPKFAPAWARLGRIHHVLAKYIDTGAEDGFVRAEAAFRRALALNPELTIAHKLYAQLESDLGRARDAMARLVQQANNPDPELLAGLVSTCRYCGLLEASADAHTRAVGLEPRIRTSVPHTWFLQGDYARVAGSNRTDFPYIVSLSLAELGRANDALPPLRELESTMKTRVPGFVVAGRALLEGKHDESIAALHRVVASGFKDPEGLYYAARHLSHLKQIDPAIDLLGRVIAGGFHCYPAMAADKWLDPLRKKPKFAKLLSHAEEEHKQAVEVGPRWSTSQRSPSPSA